MAYLTIGQLNIPVAWLAFFMAIFYSDFRNKGKDEATTNVIGRLFWIYLLVWKGSYILFFWDSFWQSPLSLLYFDGGLKGHALAAFVGALLLVKHRQVLQWELVWCYWARFVAISQAVSFIFSTQWLLAVLWLLVLVLIEWKWQQWIFVVQWALLVWLNGWLDAFVFVHGFMMLSAVVMRKERQFVALTVVLTLVAMTVTDFQTTTIATARQPIDLMTTEQERYILSEQEQTLTVVNFFATWCPPCKAEMPHLQSFADDLPHNVALVGINLTSRDDGPEALQTFMTKYNVTYPVLLDETDAFGQGYEVMSIPTTVLLNADGQEVERIVGPVSEHVLRDLIKKHQE